jgi:hypothetical protein
MKISNTRFVNAAVQRVAERMKESKVGLEGTDHADENKYRGLSGSVRDLQPMKFTTARKLAIVTYQKNPLLGRMIDLILEFILGSEFKVEIKKQVQTKAGWKDLETEDESGQNIWDDFVNNPVNLFYKRLNDFWKENMLIGELLLPTTVNEATGKVLIGFVSTDLIEKIVKDELGFQVAKVLMQTGSPKPFYDIIHTNYATDEIEGDTFLFQSNKLLGQERGYPGIMNLLDWLDMLDGMMYNALVHARFMSANILDITVTGASDDEIKTLAPDLQIPPESGSVSVHNEKVVKQFLSPDIKATNTTEIVRLFKNFILASKSLPEHWFADGGNTNLATAEAMGIPTMKMLKAQQQNVKDFVTEIAKYVLAKSKTASIKENERWVIDIQMYDFERKDASVIGAGFVQVVSALTMALSNNWITKDKAKQVVDNFIHHLGIDPDEKTVEEIEEENETDLVEDVYEPKLKPTNGKKKEPVPEMVDEE